MGCWSMSEHPAAILARHHKGEADNATARYWRNCGRAICCHCAPLASDAASARLLGFLLGDGSLHFQTGSGKGTVWFFGEAEDLEAIRADVFAIGFTPSRVYRRQRRHQITTTYHQYEFEREETSFKVVGSAFAALLAALGAPVGVKTSQDYVLPEWLMDAPLWHQRLFLAALFGAELTTPRVVTDHGYNFTAPALSLNKRAGFVASGRHFLEQVARMLEGFGVETTAVSQRAEQIKADGVQSHRLRLALSSQPASLINLWSRIGFEYNHKRQQLGLLAVEYLKRKDMVVELRSQAELQAQAMQGAGVAPQQIFAELEGEHINRRFLQRTLYEGRQTAAHVSSRFETFDQFCQRATDGIDGSGMVWATVAAIDPPSSAALLASDYDGFVYDFTVAHRDHNFVANGFVVSNCGVRLLASDVEEGEVRPHLSDLATALYQRVPSGVGGSGFLNLSFEELDKVLTTGARWALKQGMARQEDLIHTEENGSMPGATRPRSASAPNSAAGRRSARWARATTSPSWTWWTRSTTARRPRPWGCSRGRWWCRSTAAAAASAIRSAPTTCRASSACCRNTASSCPTASLSARRSIRRRDRTIWQR